MPLLGYQGLGLYLSLYGIGALGEEMPLSALLEELSAWKGEFLSLLSPLEGLGLAKTYRKGSRYFLRLLPPSSPRDFLRNPILGGNLVLRYREKHPERPGKIKDRFLPPPIPEGMEEVSEDYSSAFPKDAYLSYDPALGMIPTDRPHVRSPFDEPRFFRALKECFPESDPSLFSEEERKLLARTMALYGLDEETLARILPGATRLQNPIGRKIDFQALGEKAFKERSFLVEGRRRHRRRAVPGEGEVAEELRRMENLSPVEYLSHLQGGTRPAEPDVRLVDRLSRGMGLPSPVINALMNHLVVHYDGMIPASLAEKIAGSLLRNGIESAMDAVDYLNSTRGRGKKDRAEENPLPKAAPPKEEPPEEEEEMSDEELIRLLRSRK